MEALVSFVAKELGAIVKEEVGLLVSVKKELETLSSTFSAILAVLEDAERQQFTEKGVRGWLGKIKKVAYEMEDILDEWRTNAFTSQQDEDDIGEIQKVLSCLLFLCPCFKQVQFRHDIGHEIRGITERLNKIYEERRQYKLKESEETNMREDMSRLHKERETGSLIGKSVIFGRDDVREEIIRMLDIETGQKEKSVFIVSIVGMGGLGKTTLARLVYDDETVKKHLEKRIWVCVSVPFDAGRIAKEIIRKLDSKLEQPNPEHSDLDTWQHKLCEAFGKEPFLLVLDDVWDDCGRQWEKLWVPLEHAAPGSRVVVTTRLRQVAEVMDSTHIHDLGKLPDSYCWELFASKAFEGREEQECMELREMGEEIVRRCDGLPLALEVVGSLCREKRKQDWVDVLQSEIWEWKTPKHTSILPSLLLSYYDLPVYLRRCFSFCSIFPKDHAIDKDELVKLWMAHGFIKSEERRIEKVGKEYFDDLVKRTLFQQEKVDDEEKIDDEATFYYKMHDLVHDLATFVESVDDGAMEIENLESDSVNYYHLSILLTRRSNFSSILSRLRKVKRLRTLLLYGWSNISAIPYDFFNPLRFLRALDLSGTSIDNLPSFIGKLKHLRYLNLCELKIQELPGFVTDLYNLQTLKLDYCQDLRTLPSGMSKLVKLRHLEIEGTKKLKFLPNGLGRLSSLRTLCKFPVGDENRGCKIEELKNLNLLIGEFKIQNLERVMNVNDAREAELHKKSSLHVLSLSSKEKSNDEWRTSEKDEMERMEQVLENLRPPHSNLKELKIINYAGQKFPSWLEDSEFSSLVRVVLKNCRKCTELPGLGKLHSLKYLEIIGAVEVKVVGSEFYGNVDVKGTIIFPKLEKLQFCEMLNWEEWKLAEEHGEVKVMPSLKTLEIEDCNKLKVLPTCLPNNLIKVEIRNCKEVIWAQENPLPHLRYLTLHDVRGISSVKALPSLPAVEALEIWGFSCESLPSDGWGLLESLHTLKICRGPELASLPGGLGQLKALQTLEISYCQGLSSLPDELGQLKALQTLTIEGCQQLSYLLDGLGKLKALQTLRITGCTQLSSLPRELGQLRAIRTLEISYCQGLSSLPEELGQLKALQTLKIEGCERLSCLPDWLQELKALQCLNIGSFKQLSSLPEWLGQLKALETLSIYQCDLFSALPDWLGQLDALQVLSIRGCHELISLFNGSVRFKALQRLTVLDCNRLTSLSDGLLQLEALRSLSVWECERLTSLFFDGFEQLKSLSILSISNCPQLRPLPNLQRLTALDGLIIKTCHAPPFTHA